MCRLGLLSFVAVLLKLLPLGVCSLVLELREPAVPSAVLLTIEGTQPRPISLAPGRTYHIMCRDTSNTRRFDDSDNMGVWRHNGSPVQTLSPGDALPGVAVYASTAVSPETNEWTLVLQQFGGGALGLYSCHGLEVGQILSLDIGQTSLSVIAGTPQHILTAGPLPSNGIISLSPFISPSSSPMPAIIWQFNGSPHFPSGVRVLGSEVLLWSPITGDMRGNYTCTVHRAGISESTVYAILVNVGPNLVISPTIPPDDPSFTGGRLNVSCEDRVGFPLSDVFWNRNGTILTNQAGRVSVTSTRTAGSAVSTLLIDPVLPSDIGAYSCTTQNTVATSQRSFDLVQILDLESHVERSVWLVGEVLTLQVRLAWTSVHTPSRRLHWEWTKDGSVVSAGSRVTSTSRLRGNVFTMELIVEEAIESDSGVYSCRVSTSLGAKVVNFDPLNVFGFYVSSVGYPADSGFFAGLNLDLACEVSVSPGLYQNHLHSVEAVWMREGGVAVGSQGGHLTVSETVMRVDVSPAVVYQSNITFSPLMEGDEGQYMCTATCHLSNGVQVLTNHTRTLSFDSVLFQLRLLEVGSCQEWVNDNAQAKADKVISAVVTGVNQLCPSCALSTNHINFALFQCFPESPNAVTFRAYLHGTDTAPSEDLIGHVGVWLQADGTVPIDAVLTNLDQACPVAISSRTDPACVSNDNTEFFTVAGSPSAGQSGVPLLLVVGVSAGVGVLLVLVMSVVVSVIVVTAMFRNRRTLAVAGRREWTPQAAVSAVNPSLTSGSNPSLTGNGHAHMYEDIDKYDYMRSRTREELNSVQIMPTKTQLQIMPTNGINVPEYDYAAMQ